MSKTYDFAILGSGLYGMTIAKLLKNKHPSSKILILDKKRRIDFNKEEKYYISVGTGEKYDPSFKKFAYANLGYKNLKSYCEEKFLDFKIVGELIIANHKNEKERMNKIFKNQSSENIKLITFKEAKKMETLLNQKNIDLANIYHIKNTALVDFNKITKTLNEEVSNLSENKDIEMMYNLNVETVEESGDKIKIKTENLKSSEHSYFESKFVINTAGYESLKFANQLNLLKEYSSLKVFPYYYHSNIPAKIKYPNLIISSPPYVIHPGLSFYIDEIGNKTLGPIFNNTDKTYSFFSKLKTMNEWRKVYQIFHQNNIDPQMEYQYNSKNFVNMFYLNIYGFQMAKLYQNENKVESESSIVYSLSQKKILEDFIIEKNQKSIHLINFNLHGGFSSLIPACEEAVNLI